MNLSLKIKITKLLLLLDHMISFMVTTILILKDSFQIKRARVIVYIDDGGYGHTIVDADIARRLFQKLDVTLIFTSEVGRHNWKQSTIWQDIKVIQLLKSIRYHAISQNSAMRSYVVWVLKYFYGFKRDLINSKVEIDKLNKKIFLASDLYNILIYEVTKKTGHIIQDPTTPSEHIYLAYWFKSIQTFPALVPLIPQNRLSYFYQKIKKEITKEPVRIATIYMRNKGAGGDGELRSGCGFEYYSKSVDYLVKLGFTILLVGDRSIDLCPSGDKNKYITAERLGISRDWFNLFAVLECKLFIGDPGGGSILSSITKVPRLMINGYPYIQALHGYLILFKRLLDYKGQDLPLKKSFEQKTYYFDPEISSATRTNTEIEIFEAVKELTSVEPSIWLEYINGKVNHYGQKVDNLPNKKIGRLHLGPCRLAACQVEELKSND